MPLRGFIKGRGNHLALDERLHVCQLLQVAHRCRGRSASLQDGWSQIAWAIFCRITVLPERGGATIRPRWPLPIGAARSRTRVASRSLGRLHDETLIGIEWSQVFKEDAVARLSQAALPLIFSTLSRAKYFSFSFGERIVPTIVSPFLQVKAADLRRRYVDIFGRGKVVVGRRAQKAKAVGKDLQHPFCKELLVAAQIAV